MINYKPKCGMGIIYKYTSPSGKSYIGQTIRSLSDRAANGKGYLGSTIFYRAICKYGFKNFTREVLEECPIEKLDEREKYYIDLHKTLIPNGYNISKGGNDHSTTRKTHIFAYNINNDFIGEYESASEAERALHIDHRYIMQCCYGRYHQTHGYIFYSPSIQKKNYDSHSKPINQYDIDTHELLHTYPSIISAARAMGVGYNASLRKALKTESKIWKGYRWELSQSLTTTDS